MPRTTIIHIGTAGWALPQDERETFPTATSNLARYAQVFNAVEINSTFRRAHRRTTYSRWAESVPENFRFSVKVPQDISHVRRLVHAESAIERFIEEIEPLHRKLGCILLQLPPSLAFDKENVDAFFAALRIVHGGPVAVEPRHASWAQPAAIALMRKYNCDEVLADPIVIQFAPRKTVGLAYFRLHGSPHIYSSSYSEAFINDIAGRLSIRAEDSNVWCIFDNTARGAATANALSLQRRISG